MIPVVFSNFNDAVILEGENKEEKNSTKPKHFVVYTVFHQKDAEMFHIYYYIYNITGGFLTLWFTTYESHVKSTEEDKSMRGTSIPFLFLKSQVRRNRKKLI